MGFCSGLLGDCNTASDASMFFFYIVPYFITWYNESYIYFADD